MTAGDGYPPHADDSVNTDGDTVSPARKVPPVPGLVMPSWPKEWTGSPPGQPPVPFPDTAPLDTALPDAAAADAWLPPPPTDAYDPQPEAGPWFKPMDSSQDVPRPVPALRLPGPAVRPPRSAARRPRPAARRRWIVPLAGGLAVVLVIAVVVLATTARHPSPGGSSAGTAGPSVSAGPVPSVRVPDALLRDLTRDLQSRNEAAFLSLVAASARPSVRLWWENQQAIGFTTGAVLPTSAGAQVTVNNKGDGTTTVLAGTHSPLDPVDSNGKPDIPCERYRIGLHFAGPAAIGEITSWTPLDNDPWDQGTRLYVRKAANVVVAGLPRDSRFVNETLAMAETAARYDIGLMDHGSRHDLHQNGFVLFVSTAAADSWSVPGGGPKGWPAKFRGGRAVMLPGPGVSGDGSALAGNVSDGITGGVRVAVTPYEQDRGTAQDETLTLIRDFMLDIVAPDNGEKVLHEVQPWALEGIGIMAQYLYEGNPNPAPKAYNFAPLMSTLRHLPRSYRTGHVPTSLELFGGSLATESAWNEVAASVYAYIGTTYGVNRMLASAALLYANQNTPFGNVVVPSTKGSSSFYSPGTIEARWRAALARL
jgi:hypothetical protein